MCVCVRVTCFICLQNLVQCSSICRTTDSTCRKNESKRIEFSSLKILVNFFALDIPIFVRCGKLLCEITELFIWLAYASVKDIYIALDFESK